MLRYLVGDELGNVKALHSYHEKTSESKSGVTFIHHQDGPTSVQKLAVENFDGKATVVCFYISMFQLKIC